MSLSTATYRFLAFAFVAVGLAPAALAYFDAPCQPFVQGYRPPNSIDPSTFVEVRPYIWALFWLLLAPLPFIRRRSALGWTASILLLLPATLLYQIGSHHVGWWHYSGHCLVSKPGYYFVSDIFSQGFNWLALGALLFCLVAFDAANRLRRRLMPEPAMPPRESW